MSIKDPQAYSIIQYAGVVALAAWGGTVNYLQRWHSGIVPTFSITELAGEVATSGFAGVLAFWLCESYSVDPLITAATVGIAGHVGGRTVILIEKHLLDRVPFNIRDRDKDK